LIIAIAEYNQVEETPFMRDTLVSEHLVGELHDAPQKLAAMSCQMRFITFFWNSTGEALRRKSKSSMPCSQPAPKPCKGRGGLCRDPSSGCGNGETAIGRFRPMPHNDSSAAQRIEDAIQNKYRASIDILVRKLPIIECKDSARTAILVEDAVLHCPSLACRNGIHRARPRHYPVALNLV
jgi:hypothetical protein